MLLIFFCTTSFQTQNLSMQFIDMPNFRTLESLEKESVWLDLFFLLVIISSSLMLGINQYWVVHFDG